MKGPTHPFVRPFDDGSETFLAEGCHVVEMSNTPDDEDVSIARARIAPGATTRWHRLVGTAERYVIVAGEGLVEIGDLIQRVTAGDVALIPPLCRQRITNVGAADLVFLAVCSPRFRMRNYEDVDDD